MEDGDRSDAAPLRVSTVLGNMSDGEWPARLAAARIDVLRLDAAEAQRSRLRKRTEGGIDVALGLERGVQLRDGDVLQWHEDAQTALVARVDLGEVMVIDLSSLLDEPVETLLSRCVEVGHAVGNQHWPAVVKASQVFVPLTVAQEITESVMQTHRIAGVSWWFARGADVLPLLAPQEARLVFAGSGAGHSHQSDAGRSHEETR
jgi:urease accessory protein